ncbi:MAG: glycosyltransferase family 4 protein [Bacilli bacterium]|nr:glycosyltransferase family 4 protein [Bacilli bacterium]
MKIYWLFNHPAPYKVDFFNELGKHVDLMVHFERDSEGDRGEQFYYEKPLNFKSEILHSLKLGGINNYSRKPIALLKKEKFDLIVINGWSTLTEIMTIRYLQKHRIPYIFAINGGIAKENQTGYKENAKRKYLPGAASYLAPDENSARYLTYYGVDKEKIVIYPYGTVFENELLKTPLSKEEKVALRESLGLPKENLYVSVGAFIKRKNVDQLLRIWTKVDKKKNLLLVGDGPLKQEAEKFILENHLNNVKIVNFSEHKKVLETFRAADLSIFLTREDIYGHVVNESFSQGTPVLSSVHTNAGLKLIIDGENGYLVKLSEEERIISLINRDDYSSMGEKCLEVAKENTVEKMCEFHLDYFKRDLH